MIGQQRMHVNILCESIRKLILIGKDLSAVVRDYAETCWQGTTRCVLAMSMSVSHKKYLCADT